MFGDKDNTAKWLNPEDISIIFELFFNLLILIGISISLKFLLYSTKGFPHKYISLFFNKAHPWLHPHTSFETLVCFWLNNLFKIVAFIGLKKYL